MISLQADNQRLRAALEYYADVPPHGTYYIVEAKDRSFLSDMADWGGRAQKALAPAVQTVEEKCPICDWPLKEKVSQGCVKGNCSYRPPEGSKEYFRIKQRREQIAQEFQSVQTAEQKGKA